MKPNKSVLEQNPILKFLSKYIQFSDEEIEQLEAFNVIREYKKGSILLAEGAIAHECYFVLEGCVRSFYLIDGVEKTTEIYTEGQPISPISYVKGTPSEYYIDCLEDCVISIGSHEGTQRLMVDFPRIAAVMPEIGNDLFANKLAEFDDFKNLNPEQRYLRLLETRPGLINRVPQYHLASYLGIKPESLSRIRKRLHEKRKPRP